MRFRRRPDPPKGYLLIMLMLAVTVLSIGLMLAMPVWRTELMREKEEELIFRGQQYADAVGRYVLKNPGRYPAKLEDLLEKKYIRRLYRDPMTASGEWNIVLNPGSAGPPPPGPGGPQMAQSSAQQVLVAPLKALPSIRQPLILGVVSASKERSVKIWNEQETYDKWLFYYGQDPKKLPKIIMYGEKEKD